MRAELIRRATARDASALADLHATTVAVAYAHIFPVDSPAPTPAELEPGYESLFDEDAHVWVWTDSDQVLGSIVLVGDLSVPAGTRIEKFNVAPAAQGRGIGGALYRGAIAAARAQGCESLNLWVLEHNVSARALYERWGWTLVAGPTFPNDPAEVVDVLYRLDL